MKSEEEINKEKEELKRDIENNSGFIEFQIAMAKTAKDSLLLSVAYAEKLTSQLQLITVKKETLGETEQYLPIVNILEQALEILKDIEEK